MTWTKYHVDWSVTSIVNGQGQHDDGVRDGAREVVASGSVDKEGTSAEALRSELTALLRKSFPETELRGTYNLDHLYDIVVTPC